MSRVRRRKRRGGTESGRGIPFSSRLEVWGASYAPPVGSGTAHRPKLNCVKSEYDRSHLVAGISLNCLQQLGTVVASCLPDPPPPQLHVDGTLRPSTAVTRRKRPQWERYLRRGMTDPTVRLWSRARPLASCSRTGSDHEPTSRRQASRPTTAASVCYTASSSSIPYSPIPSPITSSSSDSPLCTSITPSLCHSRLKPTSFTNHTPCSFTSSSRTASTDFCLDRFFWATRFLILFFSLLFVSGPCAGLSWRFRQLLSARQSIVSYRILSYRTV